MKGATRFASGWMFFAIVAILACWISAFPILANAQSGQGQNAVYPAPPGTCCVGSKAFIDASVFALRNGTICSVIYSILNQVTYSAYATKRSRGWMLSDGLTWHSGPGVANEGAHAVIGVVREVVYPQRHQLL
jgi:hypothetical protein